MHDPNDEPSRSLIPLIARLRQFGDHAFDISSAAKANIDLDRLLWVRCGQNLERAFKAVDLILQSGGFGLVTLNLCDVPAKTVRRIVSSWWFRFRRALENSATALIVLTPSAAVRASATLTLRLEQEGRTWSGVPSLHDHERRVTDTAAKRELFLVSAPVPVQPARPAHTYFLKEFRISTHPERAPQWPAQSSEFSPQFCATRL